LGQLREFLAADLLISVLVGLGEHLRGEDRAGPETATTTGSAGPARSAAGVAFAFVDWRRRHFPRRFTGAFVHRDEPGLGVRTEVQDAEVTVQDRGSRVPEHVVHLAEVAMPLFLAREIITVESRGAERSDDALAIRDRRGGAVRVVALGRLLLGVGHAGLPEELAGRA